MATGDNRMPEGTDSIIEGAGVGSYAEPGTGASSGGFGVAAPSDFDEPVLASGGIETDGLSASDALVSDETDAAAAPAPSAAPAAPKSAREAMDQAREKVGDLRGQAAEKARDYAAQGKDRAAEGLDSVHRMIGEAASTIDSRVGEQYGAYARQAGDVVANLASTLREKDVDELLTDAREIVRKSPAIAIGAATAIGFVLARIVRTGLDGAAAAPSTDVTDPARDRAA